MLERPANDPRGNAIIFLRDLTKLGKASLACPNPQQILHVKIKDDDSPEVDERN